MSSTLILNYNGLIQSYGESSDYTKRHTNTEPTKSSCIGMIAAAFGIKRENEEIIQMLSKLRFGVRVDREGQLLEDYQTAAYDQTQYKIFSKILPTANDPNYQINEHNIMSGVSWNDYLCARWNKQYKGYKNPKEEYNKITNFNFKKEYLTNAKFTIAISCKSRELLEVIEKALKAPKFPLYFGRKCCPVTPDLVVGIVDKDLEDALMTEGFADDNTSEIFRVVRDAKPNEYGQLVKDKPISFDKHKREYSYRHVIEEFIEAKPDKQSPLKKRFLMQSNSASERSIGTESYHDALNIFEDLDKDIRNPVITHDAMEIFD